MHTFVDDLVKGLNRVFLRRTWEWPVSQPTDGEIAPANGDGAGERRNRVGAE